jgi:ribosome recycling factor
MNYDFNPFKKQIAGVEDWLKKEFQQIRTGQASPNILDSVKVEIYGSPMALKEVASIMIEGARTLRVAPWDKGQIKDIEKGVIAANLGLSVVVDDQGLRLNFPELTADRRAEIAKTAKTRMEDGKKQVRQHRDAVVKDLDIKEKAGGMGKDDVFRLKKDMQKIVDDCNKKLDEAFAKKEKEILG